MARATIADVFQAAAGFTNTTLNIADRYNRDAADAELARISADFNLQADDLMHQMNTLPSNRYGEIQGMSAQFMNNFFTGRNGVRTHAKNGYMYRALEAMQTNASVQMAPRIQAMEFAKTREFTVDNTLTSIDMLRKAGGDPQQTISQIESMLLGLYDKGYSTAEWTTAALAKYTSDAYMSSQVKYGNDRLQEVMTGWKTDPLADEKKQSADLKALRGELKEHFTTGSDGLSLRTFGKDGHLQGRDFDASGLQGDYNKYVDNLIDGIIGDWQNKTEQIVVDLDTELGALNKDDANYVRDHNLIVDQYERYTKQWDEFHFSPKQQKGWNPRFEKKGTPGDGSGSSGALAKINKDIEEARAAKISDYKAGLGNAHAIRKLYEKKVMDIAESVGQGWDEFVAAHERAIKLEDFIPDAVNAFLDIYKERNDGQAFLKPINDFFDTLMKEEKSAEGDAILQMGLSYVTGELLDKLADRGAMYQEGGSALIEEGLSLAAKLVNKKIILSQRTLDRSSQFNEGDYSKLLKEARENQDLIYQNSSGYVSYAGNEATYRQLSEYGKDQVRQMLRLPLEANANIIPSFSTEGNYDISALPQYQVTNSGDKNGVYRVIDDGRSTKMQKWDGTDWIDTGHSTAQAEIDAEQNEIRTAEQKRETEARDTRVEDRLSAMKAQGVTDAQRKMMVTGLMSQGQITEEQLIKQGFTTTGKIIPAKDIAAELEKLRQRQNRAKVMGGNR